MLALRTATLARNQDEGLQTRLLDLINEERTAGGLAGLKLDNLACKVAQQHAVEMAENGFLSHWSRDGLKPYQRYSFAGGTEAIEENDGADDQSGVVPAAEVAPGIIRLHLAMQGENPPNDGHRRTILKPHHTHVGFGIASSGTRVRLTEIYLSRYLAIDRFPAVINGPGSFIFSGVALDPACRVETIDVYFEPLPAASELPSLLTPHPYGLPAEHDSLWPQLPRDKIYDNGTRGSIELSDKGKFRVPITITKRPPGIHTIVVWVKKEPDGAPFPVTQACVRVG